MINIEMIQDIMPLEGVEIDYLPYIYTLFALILLSVILYFGVRFLLKIGSRKKQRSRREIALERLKALDFESGDSKELLYDFTIYAKESVSAAREKGLDTLLETLEPLKYKKEPMILDDSLRKRMKSYADAASL